MNEKLILSGIRMTCVDLFNCYKYVVLVNVYDM